MPSFPLSLPSPSPFNLHFQLPDNQLPQISHYYPTNSIHTKHYITTLTYPFNPNLTPDHTPKIPRLIPPNLSIPHTLKYLQPHFKTILHTPTHKKLPSKLIFNN
ncbi:leukocidin family pore-forming toxin, partial [Staphylococcus aureus]|uniref:leukocidin family pore-forming toxin n=1 Tax=Staphylococcus aureus TaxID=1280 RepID=UPI0037DA51AF